MGACYTYITEEMPIPVGLEERILQATIGTLKAQELRAPWTSRWASQLRIWLDPIVSPQLATVATMLLVAVFVLTNTVSADGSISGVYRASLALAEQSYSGVKSVVGGQSNTPGQVQKPAEQKQESKPEAAGNGSGEKKH